MSGHALFHEDNAAIIDMSRLRERARAVILSSSLIMRCLAGDREAIQALHLGFWHFVFQFEKAIDARANSARLPREPLYKKFTRSRTRAIQLGTAKTLRQLTKSEVEGVFGSLEAAVREMQQEEFHHSAHWAMDAKHLGLSREQLEAAEVAEGVKVLVQSAYAEDLVEFFAVLAGTEFIAEELGSILTESPLFTKSFKRGRWVWGVVHTIPHDDGPSHLEIDIDLARAYDQDDDPARIERLVALTIDTFGTAARDVEYLLCPRTRAMAAE